MKACDAGLRDTLVMRPQSGDEAQSGGNRGFDAPDFKKFQLVMDSRMACMLLP